MLICISWQMPCHRSTVTPNTIDFAIVVESTDTAVEHLWTCLMDTPLVMLAIMYDIVCILFYRLTDFIKLLHSYTTTTMHTVKVAIFAYSLDSVCLCTLCASCCMQKKHRYHAPVQSCRRCWPPCVATRMIAICADSTAFCAPLSIPRNLQTFLNR